jgi:hypothetical protein
MNILLSNYELMTKILIAILIILSLPTYSQLKKSQLKIRSQIEETCKSMGLDSSKIEIIKSIAYRESSFRLNAFNPIDSSAGLFGETKIFVKDVNRISGKNYKNSYRYDLKWSIEMLVIYLDHYSNWTLRDVCFKWHRSKFKRLNYQYYAFILNEKNKAR